MERAPLFRTHNRFYMNQSGLKETGQAQATLLFLLQQRHAHQIWRNPLISIEEPTFLRGNPAYVMVRDFWRGSPKGIHQNGVKWKHSYLITWCKKHIKSSLSVNNRIFFPCIYLQVTPLLSFMDPEPKTTYRIEVSLLGQFVRLTRHHVTQCFQNFFNLLPTSSCQTFVAYGTEICVTNK